LLVAEPYTAVMVASPSAMPRTVPLASTVTIVGDEVCHSGTAAEAPTTVASMRAWSPGASSTSALAMRMNTSREPVVPDDEPPPSQAASAATARAAMGTILNFRETRIFFLSSPKILGVAFGPANPRAARTRTAGGGSLLGIRTRWRPGEHDGEVPAVAPWLCVAAFPRLCSEQLWYG